MKNNIESQGIGKNIPYETPEGFFEQISEKTLLKAKKREQNHRRNFTLWKTMAVAASLAAVIILGFFMDKFPTSENALTLKEIQTPAESVIVKKSEIFEDPTVAIVKNDSVKKTSPETTKGESMTDVLAELSDEELIQLAAMFKSDPFLDEAMQ